MVHTQLTDKSTFFGVFEANARPCSINPIDALTWYLKGNRPEELLKHTGHVQRSLRSQETAEEEECEDSLTLFERETVTVFAG